MRCFDGEPAISRFLIMAPQPYTHESARRYLDDAARKADDASANEFAVVDAPTGGLLGGIGVHWNETRDIGEIGYWARAEARGRGVTTRALVLASRWALANGAERVQLRAEPENVASCRVAEKAGFRREGVLRSARWSERLGRRVDFAMYSLLPSDLS